MKIYQVDGPAFVDPHWFAAVRVGRHASVARAGGGLDLLGVPLHGRGAAPAHGTEVLVWLDAAGYFVYATVAELDQADQHRGEQWAEEERQRRARLDAMRHAAEGFNGRFHLPVNWDVAIAGSSPRPKQHAWTEDPSEAPVAHIYLLQDLREDCMVRERGELLCGAGSAFNGERPSGAVVLRAHDGQGVPYRPKLNCKACIATARRWVS